MTIRDGVAAASVLLVTALVAACGGSGNRSQAGRSAGVCGGQTGVSTATSEHYVVVLVAVTQVDARLVTQSAAPTPAPPAVLSGTEAPITGAGATHLELHICDRSTGAVMTALQPDVTLTANGGTARALPVAVVQDAGQGVNGTAYANNVMLDGEQTYTVDVRIDAADSVSLSYSVPLTEPGASPSPGCHVEMGAC